jgi:unsaturated rhamnogalacturonyl hydrolase
MKSTSLLLWCFLMCSSIHAQQLPEFQVVSDTMRPLELARFVANNIVDQTQFEYTYVLQKPYPDLEFIDFGKSLNRRTMGVAYAVSTIESEDRQEEVFEIGCTDGIKIWVNDQLVYTGGGNKDLKVELDEQSYVLPEKFSMPLEKGDNKILVKTMYSGEGDWQFFLQCRNMGHYAAKGKRIAFSLSGYAPEIRESNWLILGCFAVSGEDGLEVRHEPETSLQFHKIYTSGGEKFTWNIPRMNILTANPDGRFYRWVYHVGGFMWGLQYLSHETNDSKYCEFASRWCDYTLKTMPVADYQMTELHAARSMNWRRPMLDYTTAPSLAFVNRLMTEASFNGRENYEAYVEHTIDYARHTQNRLPSGLFCRRYMTSPTVWADDMFMGAPFLMLSARYTSDKKLRRELYDDAANQIIQCNKLLFDKQKKLYRQACYVEHPEQKVPFWSRGNGWAIWGTSEVLLRLPGDHKNYEQLLEIFRKHVDGIIQAQDRDGYWHNILDMPETVRESSGNAIFTLCIARGINNGWLDREEYGTALEKGWKALKTFIGQDGNLYGVKGGTNFSTDPADYEKVPFLKSDTHGVFPLLFLCIEMEKYLN